MAKTPQPWPAQLAEAQREHYCQVAADYGALAYAADSQAWARDDLTGLPSPPGLVERA